MFWLCCCVVESSLTILHHCLILLLEFSILHQVNLSLCHFSQVNILVFVIHQLETQYTCLPFFMLVYRRTYWFLVPHFNFALIFINLLHQFLQNVPTHLQIVSMPPPLRIYNSVPIYILYSLNPAPGILLAIFSACCV